MYYEHLELSPQNVIPLLYTAKKYMVKALEKGCSAYLQALTKTENACLILDQSMLYDQRELVETAKKLIQMNTSEALESETFLGIGKDSLHALLDIPSLSCSEISVFKACLRWAEFQLRQANEETSPKQLREVLEEPLKLIHFGGFSPEDFFEGAGILTREEIERLSECVAEQTTDPKGQFKILVRAKYCGQSINYLLKCTYGMMQRQAFKSMHIILKPNLPIQLKRIYLDLAQYTRSDFALTIHVGDQIYRPEVILEGDFVIDLSREVRVDAGAEFKMELFVRTSLPITVTVQSEMTATKEDEQLKSALQLDVIEASRGAGAVFKAVEVLPLAL